jgi:hypothetical protein
LRGTWYSATAVSNSATTLIPTLLQYQRERQQLEKYVTPVKYGVGAALFLFLNFRITGSPRFQAWRQDWVAQWRRRQNNNTTNITAWEQVGNQKGHRIKDPSTGIILRQTHGRTTRPPPSPHLPGGYLENKRERDVKAALSSMRLITDILVSVSVGTSGTLLLLQAHEDSMRHDFEEAPLVAGKSVVAEQMCGPFLALMTNKNVDEKRMVLLDNNNLNNNDNDDPNMITFSNFIANCRLRRDFETRIRTDEGLSSDDVPVSIPFPGLERHQTMMRPVTSQQR